MFYNNLAIPHHPMGVANQVHFFYSDIAGGPRIRPDPLLPTCSNSNITKNGVVLFGLKVTFHFIPVLPKTCMQGYGTPKR